MKLVSYFMRFWKYTFSVLLLILAAVMLAVLQYPDRNLHIIACNVGQGDAILATYGSTQILTDGGPDKSVLDCLGKYMPFWDRKIELVISTHSDLDHITGLVSVLTAYKVDKILINPIDPGTSTYQVLVSEVGGRGIDVINPSAGMKLGIGLIYLDVVSPLENLASQNTKLRVIGTEEDKLSRFSVFDEANLYSIAYILSFKSFEAFMAGDIPSEVSDKLAAGWEEDSVDYIKIPHHGSTNGLTQNLLEKIMPKIGIISVGRNSWGHPKQEILDLLSKYNTGVYRTDQAGNIEVVSDGEKYWTE